MPPLDEILFLTALVVTLMLLIIAGAAIGVAIGNRLSPPDKATSERLGQLLREIAAQRSARRDVVTMAPTVPLQVDPRRRAR